MNGTTRVSPPLSSNGGRIKTSSRAETPWCLSVCSPVAALNRLRSRVPAPHSPMSPYTTSMKIVYRTVYNVVYSRRLQAGTPAWEPPTKEG